MADGFISLAQWLQPALSPPQSQQEEDVASVVSHESPEELHARVRRLRAAVLDVLDEPLVEPEMLDRIRRYADALVARDDR